MQAETTKVFFSYARADTEFALKLAKDLRSAGVDLWIDQLDIPTGQQWDRAVESALKACQSLLIVLSPASIASQNVMDEASFAIDQNKKIFPLLYQDCEIPFRLKRLQHIDFSGDYASAYTRLLSAVKVRFPESSVAPAAVDEHKSWWRDPLRVGALVVIAAAALGSPYLYDRFTSGNGLPPIPVSELEQELSRANITLSESEEDIPQIRTWLESDPAYQALARSCLKVLAGKRLIGPVPLDVVNGRYMEALGSSSEKYLSPDEYNELGKLKAAIFATWKERHAGTTQDSFDKIVENVSTAP